MVFIFYDGYNDLNSNRGSNKANMLKWTQEIIYILYSWPAGVALCVCVCVPVSV